MYGLISAPILSELYTTPTACQLIFQEREHLSSAVVSCVGDYLRMILSCPDLAYSINACVAGGSGVEWGHEQT